MIFQSFLLGNLVSLCIKILDSVVVVGLYYGFLTTFSIGPSYLFFLRSQLMEERTEKKVAATTGFLMGQLMMFISIYYAPLHLALGRPHTITVLALPFLCFHFFWSNHKHFFDFDLDYESTSIRNFSIQCVFLNNLGCQLFNYFILPSSLVAKLVNIAMFRCNNKMLFVTSSFVGWLIGHILFLKCLGLVIVWLRQNHSIRSNKSIRSTKYKRSTRYLLAEWRDSVARVLSILLFTSCVYLLGSKPVFNWKLQAPPKKEQAVKKQEERELARVATKEELEGSFFSKEKGDPIYAMEQLLVNRLFDLQRWNQPFRYVEGAVRNEMSQYFFAIGHCDGEARISFTYPPILSICLETIKRRIRISPLKFKKSSPREDWHFENRSNFQWFVRELDARLDALFLNNKFPSLQDNILDTRPRLCTDDCTNEYIAKKFDPFLTKSDRKKNHIKVSKLAEREPFYAPTEQIETFKKKLNAKTLPRTNQLHQLFINTMFPKNYFSFHKRYSKKPYSKIISTSEIVSNPEILNKFTYYFLTKITTERQDKRILRKFNRLKELRKEVFRRTYKFLTQLEVQLPEEYEGEEPLEQHELDILSREFFGIPIDTPTETDATPSRNPTPSQEEDEGEMFLVKYLKGSNFHRDLIVGSGRPQRRKVPILKIYEFAVHSPLFLDRVRNAILIFFSRLIKLSFRVFRNLVLVLVRKRKQVGVQETFKKLKPLESETKSEKEEREEEERLKTADLWENLPQGNATRGCILLIVSIVRKYILLPSFIIGKNAGRILLGQPSEWSEDFREWDKEVHVICTYDGVPLSETEFPQEWWTEGLQIKILLPFWLKPWNKLKIKSSENELANTSFSFLTTYGMETDAPFGPPRKRPSFFKPVFKEFKKKIRKLRKKYFGVLLGKTKLYSKKAKKWVIKSVVLIKKKRIEFSKVNPIRSFRLRKVEIDESRELKEEEDSRISKQIIDGPFRSFRFRKVERDEWRKEKDSRISKQIIDGPLSQTVSPSWTSSSFTENKMNDLARRTSIIRNETETISKEKQKLTPRINNLISANKTNSNANRFEQWQILKRRNARIICKLPLFLKFFIERISTDIFLSRIHIPKMTPKLFLKFKKKIIEKSIFNNSRKHEIIKKKKKNPMSFISKLLDNISNSKTNSHSFYDLSGISQAYVFYKLSKIQVSNSSKLRSVLYYQGIPFFPKPEIKDSFEKRRVVDSKLGDKKFPSYEMNQWKNWLRGHYQYNLYNLSEKKWSRLIQKKWRNAPHKHHIAKKEIVSKRHSYEYEKDPLIDSNKQFEVYSLSNQNDTFQKDYRYDLLASKLLDSDNKTDYFFYGSPFQGNKKKSSYTSLLDRLLDKVLDRPANRNHGLLPLSPLYTAKFVHRKDGARHMIFCQLLYKQLITSSRRQINLEKKKKKRVSDRSKKADLARPKNVRRDRNVLRINYRNISSTNYLSTNYLNNRRVDTRDIYMKNVADRKDFAKKIINSQLISKKILSYLKIPEQNPPDSDSPKGFLDWMGMNEKILKPRQRISNLESWFFPEFLLLSSAYKTKPWFIPRKLLLYNLKLKENANQKDSKKNKKKQINENPNPAVISMKQYKNLTDYEKSFYIKRKKRRKGVEFDFVLKHYLIFQLDFDEIVLERMHNHIRIYCLLLKVNPKKTNNIVISSFKTKEMTTHLMQRALTVTEWQKRGEVSLEPTCLAGKNAGQFSMYQTIGISLIHRSKHETNQKNTYQKQVYVSKNQFDKAISTYERITKNLNKSTYHFLIIENLLSVKSRKKFRILCSLNPRYSEDARDSEDPMYIEDLDIDPNNTHSNPVFWKQKKLKSSIKVSHDKKHLDKLKNQFQLIKLKLFLWPSYRFEDLACMNRYWFDTNSGSRFSMLRLRMYPRLKKYIIS